MKILCLGDSLTYGYGVPRKSTWVEIAAELTGHTLVNRGISGDTSGGMLVRLRPSLLEIKPRAAIIMGGANDIFVTGTDMQARANMTAMCHQCLAGGIWPILGTQLPIHLEGLDPKWSQVTDYAATQKIFEEYHTWMRHFAKVFNFNVLDFWELFLPANLPGGKQADYYLDGLHTNAAGHKLMAEHLAARLPDCLVPSRPGKKRRTEVSL